MSDSYSDEECSALSGSVDWMDGVVGRARVVFLRKVLAIFSSQVVVCGLMLCLTFRFPSLSLFMDSHPLLIPISVVCLLLTLYSLVCCVRLQRRFPVNYLLLSLFTLSEAYLISSLARTSSPLPVLSAALLSLIGTLSLTLSTCLCESDFSASTASLALGLSLCLTLLLLFFFSPVTPLTLSLSALGVFLFGMYLVIDLQLIFGPSRHPYTPEDSIMAALNLYLDGINLFLDLLGGLTNTKP